jgi:hypothetical protein
MSSKQILEALDILSAHPNLQEYIKSFDDPQDFMKFETEPPRKILEKRLTDLLDPHGMYPCYLWVILMSNIQAVLKGVITREYILNQIAEEKRKRDESDWEQHYLEVNRRQQAAARPE